MEQLLAELRQHHAELAKRVVGSVVGDEQHLTRDQLLARAREIYARIRRFGSIRAELTTHFVAIAPLRSMMKGVSGAWRKAQSL